MNRSVKIAIGAVLIALAAAGGTYGASQYARSVQIRQYRERLQSVLRDPLSAQYRNEVLVTNKNGEALCGQVNAKNSFGGYTGLHAFVVTDDAVMISPPEAASSSSDGAARIAELRRSLDFLKFVKSHCFTEAEMAAARAQGEGK